MFRYGIKPKVARRVEAAVIWGDPAGVDRAGSRAACHQPAQRGDRFRVTVQSNGTADAAFGTALWVAAATAMARRQGVQAPERPGGAS